MRTAKKSTLFILAAFVLVIAAIILITACKSPMGADMDKTKNGGQLTDTGDGDTRLVVGIYDAAQQSDARAADNRKNIQGIEALDLTVRQIVIIDMDDRQTVILNEDRVMDILSVSKSDPVILSNVSVEPGSYKELRLVLKDENTITVNGEIHPIKIPSGEQSGLKLKVPFTIPKGKLFTLMIALDTDRSVHWNKGQGYMLKPVLNIANGPEVLGIFRGKMTVYDGIGAGETLVELYSDGTARMRSASYPRYTVWGGYNYNSVTNILKLNNFDLDAPGLSRLRKNKVMKKFPNEVQLPVKQWSLNNIIAIDTAGIEVNLHRVDGFNFTAEFTEFTLNIDYPDSTSSGKDVAAVIEFIDTGMTTQTITGTFSGSRFTEKVLIPNDYLMSDNTRLRITAYLFDNPDDLNTEPGVYANNLTEIMTGSRFSASTVNPWQPDAIFTLQRDAGYQEFTLSFPRRMNVKMDHGNFTNNKPEVSWDPIPGANGYVAVIVVKNKNYNPILGETDENRFYTVAFTAHTTNTNIIVDSEQVNFTETPMQIAPGDFIVVEIYSVDGSGYMNNETGSGILFMDTITVVR